MTIKIQEVEEHLNHEELNFFIKGNISLEKSARVKPFSWIPDQGWEDIIKLSEISADVFGSLPSDVEKNEQAWKDVRSTSVYLSVCLSESVHANVNVCHANVCVCVCVCICMHVVLLLNLCSGMTWIFQSFQRFQKNILRIFQICSS